MLRLLSASSLVVVPILVAGCNCNPCRPRCSPCAPAGGEPAVVFVQGGAAAPTPGAPAAPKAGGMVLRVEADQVVVIGPDGKPIIGKVVPGKPGEVRVVQKGGQKVVIVEEKEGKEGPEGKEGKEGEEHRARAKVAPTSPAPSAGAERGYVGFTPLPVEMLPAEAKTHWKITAEHGIVVVRVLKGSPAEKAGLRDGDLLLEYAGHEMPAAGTPVSEAFWQSFADLTSTVKPGAAVEIVVEREGKRLTLTATAIDRAAMQKIAPPAEDDDEEGDEGDEKGEEHEGGKAPAPKAPAPGGK